MARFPPLALPQSLKGRCSLLRCSLLQAPGPPLSHGYTKGFLLYDGTEQQWPSGLVYISLYNSLII